MYKPIVVVPSGVKPGRYVVEEHPSLYGACSAPIGPQPGFFSIPVPDSETALAIHLHEYSHLAIPVKIDKEMETIVETKPEFNAVWQAVYDCIVNNYVLTLPQGELIHKLAEQLPNPVAEMPDWLLTNLAIRAYGLNNRKNAQALRLLNPLLQQIVKQACREVSNAHEHDYTDRSKVVNQVLARLATAFGFQSPKVKAEGFVGSRMEGIGKDGLWIDPGPPKPLAESESIRVVRITRHVPSFVGAFRYPHRALLPGADGMAFNTKKRLVGGSVLIDVSGSMRLRSDDIVEIVKAAPLSIVAVYSGDLFQIIAAEGRMMKEPPNGHSNESDGPCLVWLSKQREPRIWVSDGQVTGPGDEQHPENTVDAVRIMRAGKIRIMADVSQVRKYFGEKTKVG